MKHDLVQCVIGNVAGRSTHLSAWLVETLLEIGSVARFDEMGGYCDSAVKRSNAPFLAWYSTFVAKSEKHTRLSSNRTIVRATVEIVFSKAKRVLPNDPSIFSLWVVGHVLTILFQRRFFPSNEVP